MPPVGQTDYGSTGLPGPMPTDMPEATDGPPLYFFLSYARADGEDGPFLARFFRDLRHEVRARCGHPRADEVGFLDTSSIRPGDAWSRELASALARCRTFVAICSPTFFTSEYCGREWQVFEDRLRHLEETGAGRAPVLLPVMWIPLRPPPSILARLQYNHEDLGQEYAKFGLRYLLQLNRNHDEYQEFLVALSDRIVRLAAETALPPMAEIPGFDTVPSAFDQWGDRRPVPPRSEVPELIQDPVPPPHSVASTEAEADQGTGLAGTEPTTHPVTGPTSILESTAGTGPATYIGPRGDRDGPSTAVRTQEAGPEPADHVGGLKRVTFVLAVTSASELAALRRHLSYYGSQYDEWKPYHPHHKQRVCVSAQFIAAGQEMSSDIVMLQTGISTLLKRSRTRNEIVVFIVDLWTATMEPFRTALLEYDQRNEPTTGVLVPWNPDDEETHENRERLFETLASTLPNNMLRRDGLFQEQVQSHEEFADALVQILTDLHERIFAGQTIFRQRPPSHRRRPFLNGP